MAVFMKLKHLKELAPGRYEYRRRVPESVKSALGKGEFKRVFAANTDVELRRRYGAVEVEFNSTMKAAAASAVPNTSPRVQFEGALLEAERLTAGVVGLDPEEAREVVADMIAARYPTDPDHGYPVGVIPKDAILLSALRSPENGKPGYSLEDARLLYLKEKIGEGEDARRAEARRRLSKVVARSAEAGLPSTLPLMDLTREHARSVRAHMLRLTKADGSPILPGSVKRDIAMLKAMVNYALREFDLKGKVENPFDELEIQGTSALEEEVRGDRDKRDALPDVLASAVTQRLAGDLQRIWRILAGTGCRLAEVTGLRREDIDLSAEVPHLKLQFHPARRLKNLSSVRSVPLVGDALEAAKEALGGALEGGFIFAGYVRPRGPDAASAALMRHLRKVSANKRHSVHSLRHAMKDKMRLAEVESGAQDLVLGHHTPGQGANYGGPEARLRVAHAAILRAAEVNL